MGQTRRTLGTPVQIRIDDDMRKDLKYLAQADGGRTLSNYVRRVLFDHLREHNKGLPSGRVYVWNESPPTALASKGAMLRKRIPKSHRLAPPKVQRRRRRK